VKNVFRVFIITAGIVLFVNVNSFALVDGAVWGGLGFDGKIEGMPDADPKSTQYGAKAHYNTSLFPLIELGFGGYYQYTKIKLDVTDNDSEDYIRKSAGLDANIILSIPIVHPYGRATYALWDKLEKDTENYKAYGFGAGIEITIFPFLRVFGEYMYEYTDHDSYIKMNSVNFGLKADI